MASNSPKYYYPLPKEQPRNIESDICIYGATPSGIAAAVQAARLGKRVSLVEFGSRIGGMTTSGLGATDIGNRHVIGGLSKEFYKELGSYYDKKESWYFEPGAALKIYNKWLSQHNIQLFLEQRLSGIEKLNNRIISLHTENGTVFKASIFIDSTYEGDLLARAGVEYATGREGDRQYDELFNGIHFGVHHHNFIRFVDPYKKAGDPSSGILDEIQNLQPGLPGEGDKLIQAFNFRLCLTKDPKNKVPWPKPAQYNPERYEILRRYIEAGVFDIFHLTRELPNGKYDQNNWGAFNTDHIGANYDWPDGDYTTREKIYQDHVNFQQGLFYFCANDPGLPKIVRDMTNEWGLAADEFSETSNWPPQLYVREARRMISDYVITEHDSLGRYKPEDSIGMASYRMDSHNCKRINKSGRVLNEGNVEISPLSPFAIPYRTIRPKRGQCTNLLVSVCISASHIGFGAIRLEPVYMILGQSAAIAATLAIDKSNGIVQDISYSDLETKLKNEGQILLERDVRPEKTFVT
jgi:hypothetical protein